MDQFYRFSYYTNKQFTTCSIIEMIEIIIFLILNNRGNLFTILNLFIKKNYLQF